MNNNKLLELAKRNRYSALINGVCLGIGFMFIILGIAIPVILRSHEQTVNGLLAIIGGTVVTAIGGVMEVYHWARIPLVNLQELEGQRRIDGFFIRCEKCDKRTPHKLVNTTEPQQGKMEETYECMQCGETKKIYQLTEAQTH